MDQSAQPAPDLMKGFRRLVNDIRVNSTVNGSGLTDVVCGTTSLLSFGDSAVSYCGQSIEDLTEQPSFERVLWLLLHQTLPTEEELADSCSIMADSAVIDQSALEMMSHLPLSARPLDVFPLCISLLSFFDPTPQDSSPDAARSRILRLLAQLPMILSSGFADTFEESSPRPTELTSGETELSWAGRLLHRLRRSHERPSAAEDSAMNTLMICQCLTEMRPACFTARFAASATTHIVAALQSAATVFVSQLRNDPYLWTSELLRNFRDPGQAEAWWRRREGQPMPFGFSNSNDDLRAGILADTVLTLLGSADRIRLAGCAARLEKVLATDLLFPTADWVSTKVMTLLDIPPERQSIVIGMARLAGWSAQAIEQQASGLSLLPRLNYGEVEVS
ncbi:MAG: citrate/2-methylcitrate synthase [Planctomycetaceae bacterium]